jgi:hypothetical protein
MTNTAAYYEILNLRTKKFYNIGPWDQCYKTFFGRVMNFHSKLERLSLASLSSLVWLEQEPTLEWST